MSRCPGFYVAKNIVLQHKTIATFLHVFVPLVTKIAVFAAQDSGDLLVLFSIRFAGHNSHKFSKLRFFDEQMG